MSRPETLIVLGLLLLALVVAWSGCECRRRAAAKSWIVQPWQAEWHEGR
jgi:hypothetical protein